MNLRLVISIRLENWIPSKIVWSPSRNYFPLKWQPQVISLMYYERVFVRTPAKYRMHILVYKRSQLEGTSSIPKPVQLYSVQSNIHVKLQPILRELKIKQHKCICTRMC